MELSSKQEEVANKQQNVSSASNTDDGDAPEQMIFKMRPLWVLPSRSSMVVINTNPWADSEESRVMEQLLNEHEERARRWLRKKFLGPPELIPDNEIVRFYLTEDVGQRLRFYQKDGSAPTAPGTPVYGAGITGVLPQGGGVSLHTGRTRASTITKDPYVGLHTCTRCWRLCY